MTDTTTNDFAATLKATDDGIIASLADMAKGNTSLTSIGRTMADAMLAKVYSQDAATAAAHVVGLKLDAFSTTNSRDKAKSQLKNFGTVAMRFGNLSVIDMAIKQANGQWNETVAILVKIKAEFTPAKIAKGEVPSDETVATMAKPKAKKDKVEPTTADTGNALSEALWAFAVAEGKPEALVNASAFLASYVRTLGETTAEKAAREERRGRDEEIRVAIANQIAASAAAAKPDAAKPDAAKKPDASKK